MNKIINIRKSGEDFLFTFKNFEKIFKKYLISDENNSVCESFAEASKDFIVKLRKEINFSLYENLDKEQSFIEVDNEGRTRIFIAHKKTPEGLNSKGIGIFISDEIYIDWFGKTHSHYVVIGNYLFFDRNLKEEEKWDCSEINDAVFDLKNTLDFPTKIIEITWRDKVIASGVWDKKRREFNMVRNVKPILFLQRILPFLIRKQEKIFYIDWKKKKENIQILSCEEVIEKMENFLQDSIGRKKLADWAKGVSTKYEQEKLVYEKPELDDLIFALTLAGGGIESLSKIQKSKSEKSQMIGVLLEEYDDNLSKDDVEKIIKWIRSEI